MSAFAQSDGVGSCCLAESVKQGWAFPQKLAVCIEKKSTVAIDGKHKRKYGSKGGMLEWAAGTEVKVIDSNERWLTVQDRTESAFKVRPSELESLYRDLSKNAWGN